jgi:MFS transporter, ACS family, aldohexuronate transporter
MSRETAPIPQAQPSAWRWYICAALFIATALNYLDRQVFSTLAPDLQSAIGWSELDYGRMVIAFQLSYSGMMLVSGPIIDFLGTRRGLAAAVGLWSIVEAAHAYVRTPFAFGAARFFLGLAEAANFPAAIKAVAEWFPSHERAFATGVIIGGVGFGAIAAPIIVPIVSAHYGWRAAFLLTAAIGPVWLTGWWLLHQVAREPRLDHQAPDGPSPEGVPWSQLLRLRQTWAIAASKALADPVWWFYLFWLPKFLAEEHGVHGAEATPYLAAVYVCADVGAIAGGYASSLMLKRGWSLNAARKGVLLLIAIVITPMVIAAGRAESAPLAMTLVAIACGGHQAWSAILWTLSSDLFPSRCAASVTGLGACVAGLSSIVAAELTGRALTHNPGQYQMVFIIAGLLYPAGLAVLHFLSPMLTPASIQSVLRRPDRLA